VDSKTLGTLTLIFVIAVLSPAAAQLLRRYRISDVVIEILVGILVGPQVLGIAQVTPVVKSFSAFGLSFLMFLAGFEIDFRRIRNKPVQLATAGWLLSLAIGLGIGWAAELGGR